ncbi:MAG: hypothetical protein H5T86_03760, partial [Armatimonadetes bacterium]|nr:hypothetical protein [Armatimonadota bacterium]
MKRNLYWVPGIVLLIFVAGCQVEGQATAQTPVSPPAKAIAGAQAAQPQIKGHVETIGTGEDAIDVIYLEGSPYEMGYTHGKLLADKIKKFTTAIVMAMCVGMKVPASKLDEAW